MEIKEVVVNEKASANDRNIFYWFILDCRVLHFDFII